MKLQKLEVRLQREADRDWGGLWDLHLLQMRVTRLGMMWQPARSQPFPRGGGGAPFQAARNCQMRRWKAMEAGQRNPLFCNRQPAQRQNCSLMQCHTVWRRDAVPAAQRLPTAGSTGHTFTWKVSSDT